MEKYGLFLKGESGIYDVPTFVGTQKEVREFAETNNVEYDYVVCDMECLYLLALNNI